MDHQEGPRASGNNDGDVSNTPAELPAPTSTIPTPLIICGSARMTKGIPCICTDEDPKLELGSRSMASRDTQRNNPSVGAKGRTAHEDNPSTHTDNKDASATFLTADDLMLRSGWRK